MTLSDLILEYVDASKRADKLVSHLRDGKIDWRINQDAVELEETLAAYTKAFTSHRLDMVAFECAKVEDMLNTLRKPLLRRFLAALSHPHIHAYRRTRMREEYIANNPI